MAAVRGLTGGADYAFEALGREETVQQAWASLDVRGQLVLVGLLPGGARITLDAGPFVSEQSVKGCYFGRDPSVVSMRQHDASRHKAEARETGVSAAALPGVRPGG